MPLAWLIAKAREVRGRPQVPRSHSRAQLGFQWYLDAEMIQTTVWWCSLEPVA